MARHFGQSEIISTNFLSKSIACYFNPKKYNINMKTRRGIGINKRMIDRVVSASCRLEGIDFERARKNNLVITRLKKYGRGFSI